MSWTSPYGTAVASSELAEAEYQPIGYSDIAGSPQEYADYVAQLAYEEVDDGLHDENGVRQPHVAWKPHPGFQDMATSLHADELLIGGAAGPGKTDCLIYGSLAEIDHPATRVLFLRRTFGELREVMDRTLTIFPSLGATWRESEKRWRFPSGATFEFGYCETYADATRYQGQEYTRINFDELGQVKDERIVDFLITRLRTTAVDYPIRPMFAASANPGGAGHAMLKRRYVDPTLKGTAVYVDPESGLTRAFIPGKVTDNPSIKPEYIQRLMGLPAVLRRQLLDGDWEAGAGAALDELDETVHLIPPFQVPDHWPRYAGFDWGFRHPWWFIDGTIDPDGNVYILDCAWGRQMLPHDIAQAVQERWPTIRFQHIAAGHDVMHNRRAIEENTPTIAETFLGFDLILDKANIHRVLGLNNCRALIAWRTVDRGSAGVPRLRFFKTPRVLRLFSELKTIVTDPDNPEDALKVNANPDTGEGGDDAYDCFRYLCATRIMGGLSDMGAIPLESTTSPEILRAEVERLYRRRGLPPAEKHSLAMGDGAWQIL